MEIKQMLQEPRTDDAIPRDRLSSDAERVFEVLEAGGVAIVPLDVAYAIIGMKTRAIAAIFEAKQRSFEKPSGMFGNLELSNELHILTGDKREIARTLIEKHNLPFSIVADYRLDHPLMRPVEAFVLENSTKGNTLDMLINAGALHNEIARLSAERGLPVFGSSANRSLTGSKYRLQDIEPGVRAAATLAIDHGTSKYANPEGRSSTIIDFRDFLVVRRGVCFDQIQAVFQQDFGIKLATN
jgi:tRNA A37 threonylcarbamoyladenosine synthetase subunit TsaC/SUA5/YrdC